jgi:hypothetical protein
MSAYLNQMFDALNSGYEAFKDQWENSAYNTYPCGELIYKKSHPETTEAKINRYILTQEDLVVVPESFVDQTPPKVGYHGTSYKAVRTQIEKGKLDNRNMRVYVADNKTAGRYARSKELDGEEGVILELSSSNGLKMNGMSEMLDYNRGAFSYVPPGKDQEVNIEKVWKIRKGYKHLDTYCLVADKNADVTGVGRVLISSEASLHAMNEKVSLSPTHPQSRA